MAVRVIARPIAATRMAATLALLLGLAGCASSTSEGPAGSGLPTARGPLPTQGVVWAVGRTVHLDEQTLRLDRPPQVMVAARGRLYYVEEGREALMVTDGERARDTGFEAGHLAASTDGRYLGFLDRSEGMPWSTVVVDLESGEVVVDDHTGMGGEGDDLPDLYEDAQPEVVGFDGDDLYVRPATGAAVLSWDAATGERTDHDDDTFVAPFDPGGGRSLPALVRNGRLVVPQDPYRSTRWGHASPDGAVALRSTGDATTLYAVASGRRLPVDLHGRHFLLGGWTGPATAYGLSFRASAYGPVRLVACRLSVAVQRCRVLREVRKPRGELVLFPTGAPARDF